MCSDAHVTFNFQVGLLFGFINMGLTTIMYYHSYHATLKSFSDRASYQVKAGKLITRVDTQLIKDISLRSWNGLALALSSICATVVNVLKYLTTLYASKCNISWFTNKLPGTTMLTIYEWISFISLIIVFVGLLIWSLFRFVSPWLFKSVPTYTKKHLNTKSKSVNEWAPNVDKTCLMTTEVTEDLEIAEEPVYETDMTAHFAHNSLAIESSLFNMESNCMESSCFETNSNKPLADYSTTTDQN